MPFNTQTMHIKSFYIPITAPNFKLNRSVADTLDHDSESKILNVSMSLVAKMVDLGRPFHLTLLALSVSDFVASAKHGIQGSIL
jgi:hypothetical protein